MSLIGKDELRRRIFDEGEILDPTCASEGCLRAAGYDVRLAPDRVAVDGRVRGTAEKPCYDLSLHPGEVASVSTLEQFRMPWDVAANIGVRFHFAQRGLLVFTGLLVDPGYGLAKDEHCRWQPRAGERLHFFIANLGEHEVPIRLGTEGHKVLSLQFFSVDESVEKSRPSGSEELRADALSVFSQVRKLERELKEESDQRHAADERFQIALGGVTDGTQQIVLFGVFLLAVSVIGVVVASLIDALASSKMVLAARTLNKLGSGGAVPILVSGLAVLIVACITLFAVKGVIESFLKLRTNHRIVAMPQNVALDGEGEPAKMVPHSANP